MPEISIIIINYNTFQLTSACIESIILYTKKVSYEIILVDNASTECLPDLFLEKFPSIQLIKSSKNLGFSKGNNLGISKAKGEILLLLNSDTTLVSDAISDSYERLHQEAKCGLLSCKLVYPDGRLQYASQQFRTIKQEIYQLFKLHRFIKPLSTYIIESLKEDREHYTDWVWGTFFMIKKEVVAKFPEAKLHETFFMYGEDKQWSYNVHKLGYQVLYYPKAVIIHHISASSGIKDEDKFKNFIWPHEKIFMQLERGRIYAFTYFLLKSLNAYATRVQSNYHWGKYFFKLAMGQIKSKF